MSFATAMTAIGTSLVTVGAACTPAITDVARGAPVAVNGRMFRYWYAGTSEPPHYPGGTTLTTRMIGRRVTIGAFFPSSADKATMPGLDVEIQAVEQGIFASILGNSQLDGACDDLLVGDATVDYSIINGALIVELLIPLTLDFGEAYTIAP